MRQRLRVMTATLLLVLTIGAAQTLLAQTSASDFYLQYRKVLTSAKKVEDIFPFVSEKTKKQMLATPADQRGMMFGMMQEMNQMASLKVVKETRTDTGATLTVEGKGDDKTTSTGTILLVTENGGFKIDRESWSTK
jgi:hypothetical protein